jgi:uncharacterized protein YjbI with pentapeptide repeats
MRVRPRVCGLDAGAACAQHRSFTGASIVRRRPFTLAIASTLFGAASGPAWSARYTVEQVREAITSAGGQRPLDLSEHDLSDLDLSRLDFRKARLAGTSFFASKLVMSDFGGADLTRANLNGAWLMGTDFRGATLVGSSLLSVVVLGGEVKKPPNFEGADLSGARVIADFPNANLRRAKLVKTNLGVNIKNQGMGQMRTDLSSADLTEANLEGADLNRSLMNYAKLSGANLRGVNFYNTRLSGADLRGADVTGADFTEADLTGVSFDEVKGLGSAKGLALK